MEKRKSYVVTMKITPPVTATRTEVLGWLAFEVGKTGSLSLDHPLADCGIEHADIGYIEIREV